MYLLRSSNEAKLTKSSFLIFVESYLTCSCSVNCIGIDTKIVSHQQKITGVHSILPSIKIVTTIQKVPQFILRRSNLIRSYISLNMTE
jgi:hypothetical protein